jgi:hypothetical protein
VAEEGYRDFYRIVLSYPSTLYDYQSSKARGGTVPATPSRRAVWDGLSVFSTRSQARRKCRVSPMLGSFIAQMRVPTDGSVRFERTLGGDGHHTIWGDPEVLMTLEVSVEPADPVH